MNQDKVKILFVTFASSSWKAAGKRIIKEAQGTNIFYKTLLFTEKDLCKIKFKNFYGNEIKNTKGYGYYAWKFNILKYCYENEDYDYLLYLDAGSEININNKNIQEFYDLVEKCKENNFVVSVLKKEFLEKNWSKKITIEAIGCDDIYSTQFQSGFILCNKSLIVKKIIDDAIYFSELDGGILINNSEKSGIDEDFVDHRHDQSILSLLLKKNKISGVIQTDFWTDNWKDYNGLFAGIRNNSIKKDLI